MNVEWRNSAVDTYTNGVFKIVILIIPIFCLCASITITTLHFVGWYPDINEMAMWIFDGTDVIYMTAGFYFVKTSYGKDGRLIPRKLTKAKYTMMLIVIIQWNMITYIWPFSDFWAYGLLFTIVEAFFFDAKLVAYSSLGIVVSMFFSWFVKGERLMPAMDEYYHANMVFRIVGFFLMLLSVNIITYFGRKFIIEGAESILKAKIMEEENIELERAARMKSDFLANMSHEIRTPMNAVIGMAEIAMREELPPNAVECLAQIQKSGRNLLNIINDILDYSKIESGKMEIIPERYEPSSELNDISNILTTRVGDKKLELYVVTDTNIPHALYGDAMRIRQVLINLTNNAIKFTKQGKVCVKVTCEYVDSDMVTLTYHIKDTGIGIREKDMEKLFVSFQQVDSRRNRTAEGTGLGLAISQKLVEAMGGEIGVNSVYGEGSDFWFTIPQKVLDPASAMQVKDANGKKAIVMDDDTDRVSMFMDEVAKIGIDNAAITGLNEYKASGKKDYLFFEHKKYDASIQHFLDRNMDVCGVVLIDYNSDFKPDRSNLHTLRRPVSTMGIIRVLNGNDDMVQTGCVEEAYSIDFTAPTAKILVVDDNAINITIVKGLLAPMQVVIESALSGQEAINKVQNGQYDIVLMDHMMPEMDGVDATKIIRNTIADKEHLVIIALSANAMESSRKMFLEAGMNDFIAKPVEIKELVGKIKKWLPKEKIIKGVVQEVTKDDSLTDPIMEFQMLDATQAIKALGSSTLYHKIVEEYYRSGEEKYSGILKAYQNEDISDYTIRVHALKSSSRQIGAYELGDMAEKLESAANSADMDTIKEYTENMLSLYRELLSGLVVFCAEPEDERSDLPLITNEILESWIEKLKLACDDLDMDGMEDVKNGLKKFTYPEEIRDNINRLCQAIDNIDIDACEEFMDTVVQVKR